MWRVGKNRRKIKDNSLRIICEHALSDLPLETLDKTGRNSNGLARFPPPPSFFFKPFFLGYFGQRVTSSEMAKGRQQAGKVEANGWGKTQTVGLGSE